MSKKHILIRTVSVINITHKKQFAPDNLKHLTTTIQNENHNKACGLSFVQIVNFISTMVRLKR